MSDEIDLLLESVLHETANPPVAEGLADRIMVEVLLHEGLDEAANPEPLPGMGRRIEKAVRNDLIRRLDLPLVPLQRVKQLN